MKQIIVLPFLIFFLFPSFIHAQPQIGRPAPPLDLKQILQGGEDAGIDKLAGKYVLIEFWATWCTPCIKNIPHLNALYEKFKDKDMVFISVTDEDQDKINTFLAKRSIKGWVGVDNGGSTFNYYNVQGRPATFIVDKNGIVVFAGDPSKVTEELLEQIVTGKYVPAPERAAEPREVLGSWGGGQDPVITANFNMDTMGYLHQQVIRKTVYPFPSSGWKENGEEVGITYLCSGVKDIIAGTTGMASPLRVVNRSSVSSDAHWDVIFSRHKGYTLERGMKEVEMLLCQTFSVSVEDGTETFDVLQPEYARGRLIAVNSVKEDDPGIKAYQLLSDVFNTLEKKKEIIVNYDASASEYYIEVFALGNGFYRMSGDELQSWLEQQGILFKTERKEIPVKVLKNS